MRHRWAPGPKVSFSIGEAWDLESAAHTLISYQSPGTFPSLWLIKQIDWVLDVFLWKEGELQSAIFCCLVICKNVEDILGNTLAFSPCCMIYSKSRKKSSVFIIWKECGFTSSFLFEFPGWEFFWIIIFMHVKFS